MPDSPHHSSSSGPDADGSQQAAFASAAVDRLRAGGGVWDLPGGQLLLPSVFGFCRGVHRALTMLQKAVATCADGGKRLLLLGQIIHNPWVNDYFQKQGVRILTSNELADLSEAITADDCAVIPAFGVSPAIQQRLAAIGCEIIDTSCGDVRRLWRWAERAADEGYGIVIFGRAAHDETVVTKNRLSAAGGRYVVVGDLDKTRQLCELIRTNADGAAFQAAFPPATTNADSLTPFEHPAQVSQTTMLYDDTVEVRGLLRDALAERFGPDEADQRLRFEPTVCHATQDRQNAAIELCRSGVDLAVVVGGYGSSNTRHLFELASTYAPSWFIEDASAIHSAGEIQTFDPQTDQAAVVGDWLPAERPLRIAVLAGASSPEVVIGDVLEKLAALLS
jgi:4-hydroxy-3-methylbut-2-enyl diphosphate reductase